MVGQSTCGVMFSIITYAGKKAGIYNMRIIS